MTATFGSFVFLFALIASQTPQTLPPPPQGKIAGIVRHGVTGQPVEDVTIRAVRWDGGRGEQMPVVATGADGRFVFERLRGGEYSLTFSAARFVSLQYGQRDPQDIPRRIELKDNEAVDRADMVLPPTSAIEGRLLDEFGDPAPGILVQAAQVQWAAGKRRLAPFGAVQSRTDDLGRFRVTDVPPGTYYLLALAGPFAGLNDPSGFAVTYFPGTAAPMEAKPVHVALGQEVSGLAFPMVPAPMSAVSGVLVDETDKPIPGTVTLMPTSAGDVQSMLVNRVPVEAAGTFSFRNIAPGSYVIQAFGRPVGGGNLGRAPFASWPLTLSESTEITNLRVKVTPGATARGRFVLEGDPATLVPKQVSISLSVTNFASSPAGGGPPNSVIRDDWTFEVNNMFGARTINIFATPAWTLKKVTRNGLDITDDPVDFRDGDVDGLEIMLTSHAPVLTGSVTDSGKPPEACVVIVFAEDPAKWVFPSRYFGQARANPAGQFRIQGLPPGGYLVAALPSVRGGEWQDPEFLKKHYGLATRVTLSEASTSTVALRVIR